MTNDPVNALGEATEVGVAASAAESGSPKSASADRERMVIFVRTFDFLAWLLPMTNHFPRSQRHTITQRLLDAAMDLRERLEEANQRRGGSRRERLDRADECLAKVRLYLRLAFHLRWMTEGQYFHAARFTAEIGRLLGGWKQPSARALDGAVD